MSLSTRLWCCLLFSTLPMAASKAAEKPNILFIFSDDQAPWALGRSGDPNASTPNLDRLAAEGAYLPNSFTVTPVCSPSRVSLMTSRYGSEMGITDWIKPKSQFSDNPENQPGIASDAVTFPKILAAAGYQTALIGKYHLGERPECHPTRAGFQHFMGFLEGGTTPENPRLERDGVYQPFKGLTVDILTDHALEYLDDHHSKPFFLAVHYRSPHTRWLPVAPEDWAPFEELDPELAHPDYPGLDVERAKKMMREYLASTRGVDRSVGRLLAKLDDLKIAENTVVIFSSDHGYNMAHNGIWHKGNGHWLTKKESRPPATENVPSSQRPNLYDTSLKVPTIVRWPGTTEQGQVIDQTVSNLDWFPTFVEISGAGIPGNRTIRGRSIVPLLKGESPADWENGFFGQYSTRHQSRTDMRCWRSSEYKLIRDFLNPERDEFYDLVNDPGETTNLIGKLSPEQKNVREIFDTKIHQRMAEIGDTVTLVSSGVGRQESFDFNFDGHPDYRVKTHEDGKADRYDVFIFEPGSEKHVKCEPLSGTVSPAPVPEKKEVHCTWPGGHSGRIYLREVYRWNEGRAEFVSTIRQQAIAIEGAVEYIRVTAKVEGGKPVISSIERVPDQEP